MYRGWVRRRIWVVISDIYGVLPLILIFDKCIDPLIYGGMGYLIFWFLYFTKNGRRESVLASGRGGLQVQC